MAAFEKAPVVVRSERTWLVVVAAVVALFGLPLLAPLGELRTVIVTDWIGIGVYITGVAAILVAWKATKHARTGALRADSAGVALDGQLLAPRAKVRRASIFRYRHKTIVRLSRGFGEVDVEVADDDEGEKLLAAMNLSTATGSRTAPE